MRSHRPRRRRHNARKSDWAWEMFGEMGEHLESDVGIPAGLFVEAAAGMVAYRPLACAACDSGHGDMTAVCVSCLAIEEGAPIGPFVLWVPCLPCLEAHGHDISSMMVSAEPAIDMWLLTHEFPGSVAVIDEGDFHDCGET